MIENIAQWEVGGGGHKGRERQRCRDSVFVGFCTPKLKSSGHNRVYGTCRFMYFLWFTRLLLSLFPISAYLHPLLAVPVFAVCGCRSSHTLGWLVLHGKPVWEKHEQWWEIHRQTCLCTLTNSQIKKEPVELFGPMELNRVLKRRNTMAKNFFFFF